MSWFCSQSGSDALQILHPCFFCGDVPGCEGSIHNPPHKKTVGAITFKIAENYWGIPCVCRVLSVCMDASEVFNGKRKREWDRNETAANCLFSNSGIVLEILLVKAKFKCRSVQTR